MTNLSRAAVIERLRNDFTRLTDEDSCMCKVAAEKGIFCGGFAGMDEGDLRERYAWIVRRRPQITRGDLESIANQWQLAQQQVKELPLACDVQTRVHDTCRGWDEFTNAQLALFYQELTGEAVTVLS